MADTEPSQTQLRLLYSLLKPAVAMAARFRVPMRTVAELARLAYFETLRRDGLSHARIAERLGLSERHVRSLQKKLKTNFFAAESEIGLVREVEDLVSARRPSERELLRALSGWDSDDVRAALSVLVQEGRVVRARGRLQTAPGYVLLSSEKFHHRIDALNHFLGGVTRAVGQRLLQDRAGTAMVKTISVTALPDRFRDFLRDLEGRLRVEVAQLEEGARFEGQTEGRYVIALAAAEEQEPARETPSE